LADSQLNVAGIAGANDLNVTGVEGLGNVHGESSSVSAAEGLLSFSVVSGKAESYGWKKRPSKASHGKNRELKAIQAANG
jgi:hypothetical protein